MKQKILIKGIAGEVSRQPFNNGEYETLKGAERAIATNADCQDCFSEYMDDLRDEVTGGYMDFFMEDGELMVKVIYDSTRELTADELHDLIEYTQGQMSDGIGEGFEQFPFIEDDEGEYYVSPWFGGQKLEATQTPVE